MKIRTTRFGIIEVPDDSIVNLPEGILGFPGVKRFVLLEHDSEGTPFRWLQAVDEPDIAFIVMDPQQVVTGYEVRFDDELSERLGCRIADEKFAMMAIVNVPRDNPIAMTVNIRAPIIVHLEKRIGWQVVLPNEEYPIRHRLFPDTKGEGESESEPRP